MYWLHFGHVTAQEVNCWLLTAEARVHSQASQCGICYGQSGIGTDFSPSPLVSTFQYYSSAAVYSLIYNLGDG
jgi:hypothetical protein